MPGLLTCLHRRDGHHRWNGWHFYSPFSRGHAILLHIYITTHPCIMPESRQVLARSRRHSYVEKKKIFVSSKRRITILILYFKAEMASPDGSSDFRLEYIGAFVQKSLKLKPEKWGRLLLTEEYRNAVHDFLDNPLPAALFVALTPNAQLVACTSFPVPCQRTKGENEKENFLSCRTSLL